MTGKKSLCLKCNKDIGKGGSIQCEACTCWFHIQCVGISEQLCNLLAKQNAVSYKCESCKNNMLSSSDVAEQIRLISMKLDSMSNDNSAYRDDLNKKIDMLRSDIREEFTSKFANTDNKISSCVKQVKSLENCVAKEVKKLNSINNTLFHRMNRADIVVFGLLPNINDLEKTVTDLCAFYNINISATDIHHTCYFNNNKSVLVRFCNVRIRDRLMAAYNKNRSLKLADIVESDINSRVYLNDHFSPSAARMNSICKRLLKEKKIKKFKIFNGDNPKVSITYENGSKAVKNFEECELLSSQCK